MTHEQIGITYVIGVFAVIFFFGTLKDVGEEYTGGFVVGALFWPMLVAVGIIMAVLYCPFWIGVQVRKILKAQR